MLPPPRSVAAFACLALLAGCATDPTDMTESNVRRWQSEADQGDAGAHYYLGAAYHQGRRVEKDTQAAYEYWLAAANRGDARAQHNLGVMHWAGDWVRRDLVLAYMWLNLAAGQGLAPSARMRDELEPVMSKEQIVRAQQLAENASIAVARGERLAPDYGK